MPKNDIGGFFVSLGLSIDKNSFETGNKLIDGVANSFNKLIGSARNAAVVLAGTAVATGVVESSAYKTASAIGITTEALDVWKASAKIAGVNADGLVNSMSKVGSVLSHIKIDGSGLQEFSKKLGEIGMHMEELKDENGEWLSADKAYEKIIAKGQQRIAEGADRHDIIVKMGDILGGEGQSFFIELLRQQKTIEEFLTGAGKTVFTTAADNEKGANFSTEVNTLKAEFQSIGKLLGDNVGGELTPYLKQLNDWIQVHGPEIQKVVSEIAGFTARMAEKIAPIASWIVTPGQQKDDSINVNKYITDFKKGILKNKNAEYGDLDSRTKDMVARYYQQYGNFNHLDLNNVIMSDVLARIERMKSEEGVFRIDPVTGQKIKMQNSNKNPTAADWWKDYEMDDGIMRPDGTVTKIAPDDWVFAARDIGNMARAFIPQNYNTVSAPTEYSIVQNFTINGGNDMPQLIKQQAYRGTQEGLLEVLNQSSRRLQLMSGTR